MLKAAASIAVRWSIVEQLLRQTLFLAVSIAMARMIQPEAFGIIAIIGIVTSLAGVFTDGGLSSALMQRPYEDETEISTVFWFNAAAGAFLSVLIFLLAPQIARYFSEPILVIVARLYSIQFLLTSITSVQTTLFAKRLDFKSLLKANLIANVMASLVGILLAFKGFGIWALVWHTMVNAVLQTSLIWYMASWRPAFVFSISALKALFAFGGYLFLSRLLDVGYGQLYALVVGRWYGAYDLGIYNRASNTRQIPTDSITQIVNRVAFPVFCRTRGDVASLKRGFRFALRNAMFLNVPIMMGLAVVAEPLISTFFGKNWIAAAPILKILCLAGVLWPLHVLNLSALQALGHTSKFFKIEIVKKCAGLAFIFVGAFYGIYGIAWAAVASSVVAYMLNSWYMHQLVGHGTLAQLRDIAPILASGAIMAASVIALSAVLQFFGFIDLMIYSFFGAVVYLCMSLILRVEAFSDCVDFCTGRLTTK